jgi:hypothetical protein
VVEGAEQRKEVHVAGEFVIVNREVQIDSLASCISQSGIKRKSFKMSNHLLLCTLLMLGQISMTNPGLQAQNILVFEDFESGDFEGKGWYDGFPDQRTTEEYKNGSHSYAGHFAQGAKTSGAGRHLFTPTEKVYMSYWVKYSSNYVGSGVGYHPHEWNLLTNEDWIYQGPADTYLTAYIEQNAGRPILALQDGKNVNPDCILLNNNSFVGCNGDFNSYFFDEHRSVCSCNGLIGDLDRRDCFPSSGSTHGYYSSRAWAADSVYFRNTPGPYYKNDWHFIETYFEMNTVEEDIGIPNGKIRYWYDGQLLISSDSILFRTGVHPDMKFDQLLYGPYIGVGSPVDQTWWVDDLTIADGILATSSEQLEISSDEVNIYPNPNDGVFTIELPDNMGLKSDHALEIFNSLGKREFIKSFDATHTIFEIDLSSGIYYGIVRSKTNIVYHFRMILTP